MFNKILIVYNEKLTEKHLNTLKNVKEILNDKQVLSVKLDEIKESDFENQDLIITIGGDGTFVKAANFIKNQLILGINSEPDKSEGALTSIKENELEILQEILQGNFKIIERQRVQVKLNGKLIPSLGINDVYVGTSMQYHASRYIIEFKAKKEEQRSSGVIISTGSGSKAWYKSAGGTPFNFDEKKLKFLVREPYFGERVYNATILSGEISENESIKFESTRDYGGILAIDNLIYDFNSGDKAEISLSDVNLKVIVKK